MGGFWNQRHEMEPVVTDTEGRKSWSDGRERYLTLLVDVCNHTTVEELDTVASSLAEFESIRPVPPEYLHITVKQVGFITENGRKGDEVSPPTVETIASRASEVFSEMEPFTARLPRLNLYPSAVFCEVHDEGQLETLHRQLLNLSEIPEHQHDGDSYDPHITLSQFQGAEDYEGVLEWLESNRDVSAGTLQVDTIDLVEVNPKHFFPEFRLVERYSLGE